MGEEFWPAMLSWCQPEADATLEMAALYVGVWITANTMNALVQEKTKLLSKKGRKWEPETLSVRRATNKSRCLQYTLPSA